MKVFREAIELHESGEEFCLALLVGKSGSAPQQPGAAGLFLRDGKILGTIGGGCLEMEARRLGLTALASGEASLQEFQLNDDFGWDDGLICGGRVQVLLLPDSSKYVDALRAALREDASGAICFSLSSGDAEFKTDGVAAEAIELRREMLSDEYFILPILPRESLIIYGGGHIGAALAKIGSAHGFRVTIVDDRAEMVSETRTPTADERVAMLPSEFASAQTTDNQSYLCIVTRGHRNDARVLRELISKPNAYLGMIGSRRKREVVRKEMIGEGVCTEEQFATVRCPMGLDIGAETVEEIATSIMAELISVRASKRGPIRARCLPKTRKA